MYTFHPAFNLGVRETCLVLPVGIVCKLLRIHIKIDLVTGTRALLADKPSTNFCTFLPSLPSRNGMEQDDSLRNKKHIARAYKKKYVNAQTNIAETTALLIRGDRVTHPTPTGIKPCRQSSTTTYKTAQDTH